MKKKYFIYLLTLISILNIFLSSVYSFAKNENDALNWYYSRAKEKGKVPDGPKESNGFLKDCGGYFLGDTSSKVLYLTFDEGYEKGYTVDILDILKELNVPAAFFVVKPYIDSEPDLVKRMVEEGHLVCNHSSHHPSMASITDEEKFNKEITDVEEAYKVLIENDMPKFFRPPMGKYSKDSLQKTQALGYKTIFWSFAYKDWLIDNQPSEKYSIKKIEDGAHPGGILLLHAVSKTNCKVLKTVISDLQTDGYEFKSLIDLPT